MEEGEEDERRKEREEMRKTWKRGGENERSEGREKG